MQFYNSTIHNSTIIFGVPLAFHPFYILLLIHELIKTGQSFKQLFHTKYTVKVSGACYRVKEVKHLLRHFDEMTFEATFIFTVEASLPFFDLAACRMRSVMYPGVWLF